MEGLEGLSNTILDRLKEDVNGLTMKQMRVIFGLRDSKILLCLGYLIGSGKVSEIIIREKRYYCPV